MPRCLPSPLLLSLISPQILCFSQLYFSTRVRLKHPTMHLAVHILDRYLAALLRRSERTPFEPSGAPGGAAEGGVWDAYGLSQQAQELLGVPHALKCITCVSIWVSAS